MADRGKCRKCGKLIARLNQLDLCSTCFEHYLVQAIDASGVAGTGEMTAAKVADLSGLDMEPVLTVLQSSSALKGRVATGAICQKCGTKQAQANSPYCAECRESLQSALAGAAKKIQEGLQVKAASSQRTGFGSRMGVNSSLEEKRQRTRSGGNSPPNRGQPNRGQR